MHISKREITSGHTIIKVTLERFEIDQKVAKGLQDYKKQAQIPGFRKGRVPLSLIKKKYEEPLLFEEINKTLQESVNTYIRENQINLLGTPLPVAQSESIDKHAENWDFEFELGEVPEIFIDLKKLKGLPKYKITLEGDELEKIIDQVRQQFGQRQDQPKVGKDTTHVEVLIESEHQQQDKPSVLALAQLSKATCKSLLKKELEAEVSVDVKDFFEKQEESKAFFSQHVASDKEELILKIKGIWQMVPADLDQAFFDKVTEKEKTVESVEAFTAYMQGRYLEVYQKNADDYTYHETIKQINAQNPIVLPEVFLRRFIETQSKDPITDMDLVLEREQNALRYQIIESSLAKQYDVQISREELQNKARETVVGQMKQFGLMDPPEEQISNFMNYILGNEQERNRVTAQLFQEKMQQVFLKEVSYKESTMSFKAFLALIEENQDN